MVKLMLVSIMMAMALSVNAQETPSTILQKTADVLNTKMLYRYEASYRIKYFDHADTISEGKFQCVVQRMPKDTILRYYARLYNEKEERIYDGKSFTKAWHTEKKMIIDSPTVNGKKFVHTNMGKDFVSWFIYSPNSLKTFIKDSTKATLSTVTYGTHNCYKIDYLLTTNQEVTFRKMSFYIDQVTYLPVRLEGFAKYMDVQDQYSDLVIDNFKLDDVPAAGFASLYSLPSGYDTEFYKPAANFEPKLLPVGSNALSFTGKYANGKPYHFDSASNNQLILFDFWYTACAPCLAAMPTLQKYYQQYKAKGLTVIGINPVDSLETNVKGRNALLKKIGITYPLVYTNRGMIVTWSIYVFPSIYLIKNGKIVYTHMGSNEEEMQKLEAAIKEHINK